jgi:hypothetical protein
MKLSRMAAALIVTGLVSTAMAAGTGVAAAAAGPVLNGPEQGFATVGSTVAISGTAPIGSTVDIWFHKRTPRYYTQIYTKRRSLTVGSDGTFSTSYVANDDYRYFAQVGTAKSSTHLTQVPVQINGPATQTAIRDAGYHLTGLAIPNTVVKFHLHAKGTRANDYNMVRTSNVHSDGKWTFKIASNTDYRIFAISAANNTVTPRYLLQDR